MRGLLGERGDERDANQPNALTAVIAGEQRNSYYGCVDNPDCLKELIESSCKEGVVSLGFEATGRRRFRTRKLGG